MTVAVQRTWSAADGRHGTRLYIWCPGCSDAHAVELEEPPLWKWDGDIEAPTISPSIKVEGGPPTARTVCHSYVRNGQWEFLSDCTHDLRGQTVSLPPLPEWLSGEGAVL